MKYLVLRKHTETYVTEIEVPTEEEAIRKAKMQTVTKYEHYDSGKYEYEIAKEKR